MSKEEKETETFERDARVGRLGGAGYVPIPKRYIGKRVHVKITIQEEKED